MSLCLNCGIPLDAGIFDVSNIFNTASEAEALPGEKFLPLAVGDVLELAAFRLSPEHYGMLLYFAQYTDRIAGSSPSLVTPGYEWALRVNGRPLSPWLTFDHIINPWGMAGFPLSVRLEANSIISLTIRNIDVASTDLDRRLCRVGGRIVGRFWFDDQHGGPNPLRTREPQWEAAYARP